MPSFPAPDGTRLAYRDRRRHPGRLRPGRPDADSAYLGDLGGLSAHRRLVVLDLAAPAGPRFPKTPPPTAATGSSTTSRRCASTSGSTGSTCSATPRGANLATQYAARHPERVGKLALITPGTRAVGIEITGETRRELGAAPQGRTVVPGGVRRAGGDHRGRRRATGRPSPPSSAAGGTPRRRAHHAAQAGQRNEEAVAALRGRGRLRPGGHPRGARRPRGAASCCSPESST